MPALSPSNWAPAFDKSVFAGLLSQLSAFNPAFSDPAFVEVSNSPHVNPFPLYLSLQSCLHLEQRAATYSPWQNPSHRPSELPPARPASSPHPVLPSPPRTRSTSLPPRHSPGSRPVHPRRPRARTAHRLATRGPTTGLPIRAKPDPRKFMTPMQLVGLVNASEFAAQSALRLTAHVTVTWKGLPGFRGTSCAAWSRSHRLLSRHLASFLRDHGITPAYVWTRERVCGRGGHTHLMVHIPPARWKELKLPLQRHLARECGLTHPTAVMITGDRGGTRGMVTSKQRFGLLRYLAKPIDPDAEIPTGAGSVQLSTFLGITPEAQSPLPCKRVGWSENIGLKAQQRADYKGVHDILALSEALHPTSPASSVARSAP